MWLARLNLEQQYASPAQLAEMTEQAVLRFDPKRIRLHVAALHEGAGDVAAADQAYDRLCQSHRQSVRKPRAQCLPLYFFVSYLWMLPVSSRCNEIR